MDNEKILQEVFGGRHPTVTGNRTANPGSHLQNRGNAPPVRNDQQNAEYDKGFQDRKGESVLDNRWEDRSWQKFITTSLVRGNVNLFINIAPSAGKTYPVMKAYEELLTNVTNQNVVMPKIPVILWVAETKLLSAQVSRELKDILYKLIIQGQFPESLLKRYFPKRELRIRPGKDYRNVAMSPDQASRMKRMINDLTGVKMSSGAKAPEPTDRSIAITCTYEFASDMIKKYRPAIVVIDEVQERFKTENKSVAAETDKVRHFFNNMQLADSIPGTSAVVMTGSMNPKTSQFIVDYLNTHVKTKFKIVGYKTRQQGDKSAIRTGEPNKAAITVLPTDFQRNDTPKLVVDQIVGRNPNNLVAIFSKKKIHEFSDEIINRTSERNMAAVLGVKGEVANSNYSAKAREGRKQLNPEKPKDTISTQAKKASVTNSPKQLYSLYENMKDEKLKQAIAHGFGYIMAEEKATSGEVIRPYDNDDIYVVEELFKQGLIYTILATTSVGVGVNLKVRALYIPLLDVYSGEQQQSVRMSISTLAQLVHRAGRKAGEVGIIYCNKRDLELVTTIMSSGNPSEHVELIPFHTDNQRIGILDRFKYATKALSMRETIYLLIKGTN